MTKMVVETTARSVPRSLASVVEGLELRQPKLVTRNLLAEIISELGLDLRPEYVANRLQKEGWLLSLKRKNTWEFAPGSRAGRIDSGDPLIELRAVLHHRPDLQVSIAYESASWLLGLARRPPQKNVIAITSKTILPKTLKIFRVTRMWGNLDRIWINELPVWRMETLLVLMGVRPTAYKDWPNVSEWLPEASRKVDDNLILKELDGRSLPTWARTGYLLEIAGRRDLGDEIHKKIQPSRKGPFYFGSRNSSGRYIKRWDVIDSVLV